MVKYELLLDESIEVLGQKLFRVRAKASFSYIHEGETGGYVASEKNLSQEGNAWVFENATVFGNARVFGDARVGGHIKVEKSSDILVIGPVGSRDDFLTVAVSDEGVRVGCFTGSFDELEAAAKERDRQDYLDLLPAIRAIVARRREYGQ